MMTMGYLEYILSCMGQPLRGGLLADNTSNTHEDNTIRLWNTNFLAISTLRLARHLSHSPAENLFVAMELIDLLGAGVGLKVSSEPRGLPFAAPMD